MNISGAVVVSVMTRLIWLNESVELNRWPAMVWVSALPALITPETIGIARFAAVNPMTSRGSSSLMV